MPEGPPQSNRTATIAENPIFRILKSCRNRGSHFLQSTGLWLNCGKSTTLLQLRSIKFDCVEIAPQLVTVRGHPTKLQAHPVQLGQIANRCTRCHISAAGSRQIGRAVAELFRQTLVDRDKYRVFRRLFPFCTCFTEFSHNLSHFLVRARLFINLMSPAHASDGTQTTLPS